MMDYSTTVEIFLDAKQSPTANAIAELETIIARYTHLDVAKIKGAMQNILNDGVEILIPRHVDMTYDFRQAVNQIDGFEARSYFQNEGHYEIPYLTKKGHRVPESLFHSQRQLKTCAELEEILVDSQVITSDILNPANWIDEEEKYKLWEIYKPLFEGRYRRYSAIQWMSQSQQSYIIISTLP